MTWLIAIFARWAVSERLRKLLAYLTAAVVVFALLLALWAIWLWRHDKAVIREHEAAITEQIEAKSSEAATRASAAATQSKTEVELTNEQARAVASGSPDPLRAGLGSLRRGAATDRPAAR